MVTVHPAVLREGVHVLVELTHLLQPVAQDLDEGVAASVLEPQLEVAVSRQQSLVGWTGAPEVGRSKDGELAGLAEEGGEGDVEGPEVGCGLAADEDDAVGGEEDLHQ